MTPPEVMLWALLRRSPGGVRFRRQHPIGPYVADFYCPAAKLVIEVDGLIHDFTVEPDKERDQNLRKLSLSVIRIRAANVMADALSVADGLVRLSAPPPLSCAERSPSPSLRDREDVDAFVTRR